jgi:predicted nuclease with TOPRIM domain
MPDTASMDRLLSAIEKLDGNIEKLDTKFSEFKDEIKAEILRLSERVVILEAFKQNYDIASNRFWSQTWPSQEKYLASVDDRVRMLEREQIQQARLTELEKRLDEAQRALGAKTSELAAKVEKNSWSMNLWSAGFILAATAAVNALFRYFFR